VSKDKSVYIRCIYDCIVRINEYVRDGRESFFRDHKTQDAVIRNLEVIGQAVKDIGVDELSASQPGVPWAQVAGTRNILAHHYLGVDLKLVWNIIERDLPELEARILKMAGDLGISFD
jgi:uncharacterized protein with HEPN domain